MISFPYTKRFFFRSPSMTAGLTPAFYFGKNGQTGANITMPSISEVGGAGQGSGWYYFDWTFASLTDPDVPFAINCAAPAAVDASSNVDGTISTDSLVGLLAGDTNTMVLKALGLMHENSVLDNTIYDSYNNLTSGRLRTYDTKANALTAGATGLLHTYSISATYTGNNLTLYTVVLES